VEAGLFGRVKGNLDSFFNILSEAFWHHISAPLVDAADITKIGSTIQMP